MKVGILTYHRAYNYGAYLQACALCSRLNEEEDIDAEIIDYQTSREIRRYKTRYYSAKRVLWRILKGKYFFERKIEKVFERAADDPVMRKSAERLVSDSPEEFRAFADGKYDVIVAGSDEIWKVDNFRGFPNAYWLPGDMHCRKMSYAASARVKFRDALRPALYEEAKQEINDFEFIGIRDRMTADNFKYMIEDRSKIHLCCDPSFLYAFHTEDIPAGQKLKGKRGYNPRKKDVFVMLDRETAAEDVVKSLGKDFNLISVYKPHRGMINLPDLKPLEWLALLQKADYVIASYFHAVCFSIVNNKRFLAVGTKNKKDKLTEMLSDANLMSHYTDIESKPDYLKRVREELSREEDYSETVAKFRESFRAFLSALRSGGTK